ncbi:hypothetical protein GJ744_008457 [Endocarpon pusillum]|uniref:Uncharacterized protein n=1 Tax=Endocarpon pusillum TaxID=364733 RepID=A0A8H7ALB6_9EURO|nr:hypothetical protein GJ744_008457 [Endocarpon pusillum]
MITPTLLPCPTGYKSCPGGGCCSTNRACGLSDCPPLSTETTSSPSVDTGCANPCGFGGSLCCSANEVCNVDDSNQAVCSKTSAPTSTPSFSVQPTWLTYATTYINSDLQTITSFYSSYITTAAPTITPPAPSWLPSQGQTSCGSICCSSGQYCVTPGQCAAIVDSPTGRSESGGCARGWYACPASMGAACCPTGYVCGREACTVAR